MHKAAKLILRHEVRHELAQYGRVSWLLQCPGVQGRCRDSVRFSRFLEVPSWDDVQLEVPWGDFRFDVAAVLKGKVLMGFEVFFRHEVPAPKAQALSVPWLELLAEDILTFQPRVPYHNSLAEERCAACTDFAARLAAHRLDDRARAEMTKAFFDEGARAVAAWKRIRQQASRQGKQRPGKP